MILVAQDRTVEAEKKCKMWKHLTQTCPKVTETDSIAANDLVCCNVTWINLVTIELHWHSQHPCAFWPTRVCLEMFLCLKGAVQTSSLHQRERSQTDSFINKHTLSTHWRTPHISTIFRTSTKTNYTLRAHTHTIIHTHRAGEFKE